MKGDDFFMRNFLTKYKIHLIAVTVLLAIIAIFILGSNSSKNEPIMVAAKENLLSKSDSNNNDLDTISVDIKGAVKNPGVYKVVIGTIVNDLIEFAGGLNKNATTNNINLSKKVTDEMVIYIYTKDELAQQNSKPTSTVVECSTPKKTADINNCVTEKKSSIITSETPVSSKEEEQNEQKQIVGDLININTASKEELMTLSGIGESKAISIIDYRETNGLFTCIDDIKNISGIGNALFEKIKDNITV